MVLIYVIDRDGADVNEHIYGIYYGFRIFNTF